MAYTRVNWQNSPSHATPLSAENLNVMDAGIASLDTAVTEAEGDISSLETEVGEQATTISGLQTTVQGHTASIGTLANLTTTEKSNLVGAINEVDADVSDVKEDLSEYFAIENSIEPTMVDGKFIDASNNNISSSSDFEMTVPIPIKKGQIIKLSAAGYNTVAGMIATCNSDNTERTTVVHSIDGTRREYIYEATQDGYVVCSILKSQGYSIALAVDYYAVKQAENLLNYFSQGNKTVPIINYVNNYFTDNSGRLNGQSGWFITQSITLYKGQTITINTAGYSTSVGIINIYDPIYEDYYPVAVSIDSTDRDYSYTALETCVIRCTVQKGHTNYTVQISTPTEMLGAVVALNDKIDAPDICYPQLFDNVLCVGDSLTVGTDGNYPHFIGKRMQATTHIEGHGGYTSKQVWDSYIKDMTTLSNYDCAIIYLGTNGGLTDTVDTDCNAEDYTQNADTNTGCYGKIIGKIKADAPNCKIFCIAGPADYIRRNTTMNPAVRALTEAYEVGLIDIENCMLSTAGYTYTVQRYRYQPIDAIHYNKLGYLTFANLIYDGIDEYMQTHLDIYA